MLILQKIDNFLEETFNTGDKEIRTWFLVQQNLLPFALCGSYTLFVLLIGPAIMKNRKPFVMRMPMIIYNLFLVVVYTVSLTIIFTNLPYISPEVFCKGGSVRKGDLTYKITSCCWVIYILKYVQFLDTVFFILRKKWHLVTFLHVFHHSVVPLIGWVILRTETIFISYASALILVHEHTTQEYEHNSVIYGGIQAMLVLLNAVVHVVMYTYYGLAAVGPHMKKYLWWKKYLTLLQMAQFVIMVLYATIIAPLTGCSIVKTSIMMDCFFAGIFLILFYDFYRNSFQSSKKKSS